MRPLENEDMVFGSWRFMFIKEICNNIRPEMEGQGCWSWFLCKLNDQALMSLNYILSHLAYNQWKYFYRLESSHIKSDIWLIIKS